MKMTKTQNFLDLMVTYVLLLVLFAQRNFPMKLLTMVTSDKPFLVGDISAENFHELEALFLWVKPQQQM